MSFVSLLAESPLVGILRRVTAARAIPAAEAAAEGGLRSIEITMDGDDAIEQISTLRERLGSDVLVGAGTVTTLERFSAAVSGGAQFIVSPTFDAEIVQRARDAGLPVVPGALTPTEVLAAWRAGASIVKLFPVGPLGPGYVRSLLEPLSEVTVQCNGAIGLAEAPTFLQAGALAVGLEKPLFEDLEPAAVRTRTSDLLAALRAAQPV